MSSLNSREAYKGARRKLVLGIDVGTTFSGVSYCILDPGAVPIIQGINRYPAQERVGGDAKIPSILYYDSRGKVLYAGAEAMDEAILENASEQGWIKAEWFKLYLRPGHLKNPTDDFLPPLPLNKTVEQVFGDFLKYLFDCTQQYIQETHAGGGELWRDLKDDVEVVLTHPNGWEGAQQTQMRSAAIYAGLIPSTPDGRSRIHFVTEGEASLHFCINDNYAREAVKSGNGVIIVDAGGGTIDMSAFYLKANPNKFEEIAPAKCYFQGSVYVTRRAGAYLQNKLSQSKYKHPQDLDHITQCFDKTTKLSFKDPNQTAFVKFGSARDNDPSVNIRAGQMKMPGTDVAKFFEPNIVAIQQGIQEQKASARVRITSVLLVGGFAANDWLFDNLQARLRPEGLQFFRPDSHICKAVANGAVSFFIDHCVSVRVSKVTYGVRTKVLYEHHNPDHRVRSYLAYVDASGNVLLPDAFKVILAKDKQISETTTFSQPFQRTRSNLTALTTVETDIIAYRGNNPNPQWLNDEPDMFHSVCTVRADMQSMTRSLPRQVGLNGERFYRLECDVELLFGLTEHRARIHWKENGQDKWCPAEIIHDPEPGIGPRIRGRGS